VWEGMWYVFQQYSYISPEGQQSLWHWEVYPTPNNVVKRRENTEAGSAMERDVSILCITKITGMGTTRN
jgi:hypothetical protein